MYVFSIVITIKYELTPGTVQKETYKYIYGRCLTYSKESGFSQTLCPTKFLKLHFFPGQLAFCKNAVEGLAARRIF